MSDGTFLYPNVTRAPDQNRITPVEREPRRPDGVKGEFDKVFERTLDQTGLQSNPKPLNHLNQVREPLKFSAHAHQRLQDRKIKFDSAMITKLNDAVDKAAAKGVADTLVLTGDAALIVNVKNRTVITALDKNSMNGNVFTNIDGAVVVM